MEDAEVNAIGEIAKVLKDLSDDQRQNVLLYVNARFGRHAAQIGRPPGEVKPNSEPTASPEFADLGGFFDAANPRTEAERVLAVASWLQTVQGEAEFESYPVNKHLKNLGHPVSNITRALDSIIAQSPRLVIQVSKGGSAKQARKRYKLTREGLKRVEAMLARNRGDSHGS